MINISNKEELRQLITRYVQGKASEKEVAFLKNYYDHFDEQDDGVEELTDHAQEKLKSEIFNEIRDKIHPEQRRNDNINITLMLRLAAAVIALVVTAWGTWYLSQRSQAPEQVAVKESVSPYVRDSAFSRVEHVYLPDGSYVVLEPGSHLEYLREFSAAERKVELTGQAYFDVRKDSLRPFVVQTNDVTTRVLGTAFSITSKDKSNEFSISVTRGKVEVSDQTHKLGILQKDDQLILDRVSRIVTTNKLKDEEAAVIEPTEFIMDDMTLGKATDIVSKRWNCTFEIKDLALKNCRFTTSFVPTDDLEEVVAVIATVIGAEYSMKKNVVFLSGRGCEE